MKSNDRNQGGETRRHIEGQVREFPKMLNNLYVRVPTRGFSFIDSKELNR